MNKHKPKSKLSAFTPLRISLMIFIIIAILGAFISFIFNQYSWAHLLGIFSTVFIILVVFLQIMELIWLNSMRIHQKDPDIKKSYQKAMNIYLILLPIGIIISYLVLT
jgi:c-di-AMP phosphodiesterase-like protein